MPRKQFITKQIEGDGGGEIRYWVNPPSGYVRRLRRATAKLDLGALTAKGGGDLQDVLDAADAAFQADDQVWAAALTFVDDWTLTGWSETGEPLPISSAGLDLLDEPMRMQVLVKLSEAIEEAAKLTPQSGRLSSPTVPESSESAGDSAANVTALPLTSSTMARSEESAG